MLLIGEAVTTGPVVELNPIGGDQLYELPPEAVRVIELPWQTAFAEAVIVAVIVLVKLTIDVC